MANNYTEIQSLLVDSNGNVKNTMAMTNTMKRVNGIPLDYSSIQPDWATAVEYAQSVKAYVGQPIAIGDKLYVVTDEEPYLKECSAKTIIKAANGSELLTVTEADYDRNTDTCTYTIDLHEALKERIDTVEDTLDTFFVSAEGKETVIDTLKEIQEYINNHASDASNMLASINSNTTAISTLKGDGEGSIAKAIATAVDTINNSVASLDERLTIEARTRLSKDNELSDDLKAKTERIEALENLIGSSENTEGNDTIIAQISRVLQEAKEYVDEEVGEVSNELAEVRELAEGNATRLDVLTNKDGADGSIAKTVQDAIAKQAEADADKYATALTVGVMKTMLDECVEALNGDEQVEGSVAKAIKDAIDTQAAIDNDKYAGKLRVETAIKALANVSDTVDKLNGGADVSGSVDNKVTSAISDHLQTDHKQLTDALGKGFTTDNSVRDEISKIYDTLGGTFTTTDTVAESIDNIIADGAQLREADTALSNRISSNYAEIAKLQSIADWDGTVFKALFDVLYKESNLDFPGTPFDFLRLGPRALDNTSNGIIGGGPSGQHLCYDRDKAVELVLHCGGAPTATQTTEE